MLDRDEGEMQRRQSGNAEKGKLPPQCGKRKERDSLTDRKGDMREVERRKEESDM